MMAEKRPIGQGLCKAERLNRKKIIERVHANGVAIKTAALILVTMETELPTHFPAQAMFTVSKKLYKRAHDRNYIKRLLREGYRKQKDIVYNPLSKQGKQVAMLFIFTGRQLPNAGYVHGKISEVLKRYREQIVSQKKVEPNE
jgi:ribonuclease P protein component